ncbi:MAG TPA: glycoside hydrolase family 2 TIM barrel-domain containing protein, partial [Petrimonas sp.]|nr:glycoside hydrolase family 2 TIM barrel-domain containing protein [Petrimonas sp.]
MVRCWGGNVYEDHRFFDLCDENGIMVWQDFAMGCTFYPQRENFAKAIEQEAVAIVTKLRNHPSLVLWSGNNENDLALRW